VGRGVVLRCGRGASGFPDAVHGEPWTWASKRAYDDYKEWAKRWAPRYDNVEDKFVGAEHVPEVETQTWGEMLTGQKKEPRPAYGNLEVDDAALSGKFTAPTLPEATGNLEVDDAALTQYHAEGRPHQRLGQRTLEHRGVASLSPEWTPWPVTSAPYTVDSCARTLLEAALAAYSLSLPLRRRMSPFGPLDEPLRRGAVSLVKPPVSPRRKAGIRSGSAMDEP